MLYYKNKKQLLALLKGDKGDTGEKGDKGDKGEVGSLEVGGTVEGQIYLKNGGEGDNKFGTISSISADGTTSYLLRPYKNGDEVHEVVGNSGVIIEMLTKSRPIVRIGDGYDYMAVKSDIDSIANSIGAVSDVQINGASATENGVANIPLAKNGVLGVVQEHPSGGVYSGIAIDRNNGTIKLAEANSDAFFNNPQHYSVAVTANKLYRWIKVGLVQNDQTLTDEEKTKIQEWLGLGDLNTALETILGV